MTDHFSSKKEIFIYAIKLLQDLLDKKITAQIAIDSWPKNIEDTELDTIYSLLFHYRDDNDIREKDSRYAIWQNNEIKKQIQSLKDKIDRL
jgi:hypothetical protein